MLVEFISWNVLLFFLLLEVTGKNWLPFFARSKVISYRFHVFGV